MGAPLSLEAGVRKLLILSLRISVLVGFAESMLVGLGELRVALVVGEGRISREKEEPRTPAVPFLVEGVHRVAWGRTTELPVRLLREELLLLHKTPARRLARRG